MERKLPAYPLFVKDPNFSLWAMCDELNGADIKTWYGEEKPVYGFLKTEEGTFWEIMIALRLMELVKPNSFRLKLPHLPPITFLRRAKPK